MECYHARNGRAGNWDDPTEPVQSHLSGPGVQPITETTNHRIVTVNTVEEADGVYCADRRARIAVTQAQV